MLTCPGIFFSDNSFRLNLGLYNPSSKTNLYRLFCWLAAIGPDARAQIQHLAIVFYWDVFYLDFPPGPLDIPKERFIFQMVAWHPLTRGLRRSAFTFELLDRDNKASFRRRVTRLSEKLQLDYALGETIRKGAVRRRFLALLAREVGPYALAQLPWLRWTCKRIIDSQHDLTMAEDRARVAITALREDPRSAVEAFRKALMDEISKRWVVLMFAGLLMVVYLVAWMFFA